MVATAEYDLLVIGDVNADLILSGDDPVPVFGQVEKLVDDGVLTVGGSSAIAAGGAARLGLRTACVGVVGDDSLGAWLRSTLEERGVDVSAFRVDPSRSTGITVVLADRARDDRAILSALGAASTLSCDDVDRDAIGRSRHVHCGAYFLQPRLHEGLAGLFAGARAAGSTCSLDSNWDPAGTWDGGLPAVLEQCDLFLPNEAEALAITRCGEVGAAAACLAARVPTVAVKRGAAGGLVRRSERTMCATPPKVDPVDSTGAGDSFNAGYLFGFLNGWPAERCLPLAVACGTLSTRGLGGVELQPSLDEARQLASTIQVNVR